jgi:hypothetical protein
MRNLLIVILSLVTSISFAQSLLADRIDYKVFDKKMFDSVMLDEINSRRKEMKLQPFQFDTICHQIANFQSKVMVKINNTFQTNNVEVDGVVLKNPRERYEYFNMVNQILDADKKNLESELVTGIRVGLDSKTFTYKRLVKFVLDNFMDDDINNQLYRDYGFVDIFAGFSVELFPDEYMYNIYMTNVITSR